MKDRKNKHLTLEDRNTIQQCLDHGMVFKAIAAQIGKDPTTVSKEVKKHLEFTTTELFIAIRVARNCRRPFVQSF